MNIYNIVQDIFKRQVMNEIALASAIEESRNHIFIFIWPYKCLLLLAYVHGLERWWNNMYLQ